MKSKHESTDVEKSKSHVIVEIIEYIPNAVVSKTIIKKTTGNVTVSSFAAGEEQAMKSVPFDTYVQIIDGTAQLTIEEKKFILKQVTVLSYPLFPNIVLTPMYSLKC